MKSGVVLVKKQVSAFVWRLSKPNKQISDNEILASSGSVSMTIMSSAAMALILAARHHGDEIVTG